MTQCIAFITAKSQSYLLSEDILVARKLRDEYAVRVLILPWGSALPKSCRAVVLRSCYDYPKNLQMFKDWLRNLEQQGVQVLNPLSLVFNNFDKSYLLQLQKSGVSIIPTVRLEASSNVSLSTVMVDKGWDRVVIKPSVAVGATNTIQIDHNATDVEFASFDELLVKHSMLVQPFISEILKSGEISLIYFGGRYSHSVSKKTRVNDFRVQERFGGFHEAATPPNFVISAALKIVSLLPCVPTYARVDGVVVGGGFLLMELELIEPRLFFSTCLAAVDSFANAIVSDILP